MSDVGRYRKVFPRIWRHPGFQALPKSARELALYLLTGPQTNRIGLFHFSPAVAAEDLNVGGETIRKCLRDVCETFGWTFDANARVFYIASWWRWNMPANPHILEGNLKDLAEIPPCGLVDAFARNLQTLPETWHQTFVECIRRRLPEPVPIQYQDQRSGKQKTGKQGTRAGETRCSEAQGSEPDARHLAIARETISVCGLKAELDYMLDAYGDTAKARGVNGVTRAQKVQALQHVLLEYGAEVRS